jgi:hypothetical protein
MSVTDTDVGAVRRVEELRASARRRAELGGPSAWASAINAASLDRLSEQMPSHRPMAGSAPRRNRRRPASTLESLASNRVAWVIIAIVKVAVTAALVTAFIQHCSCR